MKAALRSILLADAGVAALVGARVSWVTRPRMSELPSITLQQIGGIRHYDMTAPSGLVQARVQVDCWALANKDAARVARAVNAAIGGLRGEVAGVEFQGCFLESELDFTDATGATPDELLHRVSQDYVIWHDE